MQLKYDQYSMICASRLVIILEYYINQLKVKRDKNIDLKENTVMNMT
jgi:hypothetical protein